MSQCKIGHDSGVSSRIRSLGRTGGHDSVFSSLPPLDVQPGRSGKTTARHASPAHVASVVYASMYNALSPVQATYGILSSVRLEEETRSLMAKYNANPERIIQIIGAAIVTWIIVDPLLHVFG